MNGLLKKGEIETRLLKFRCISGLALWVGVWKIRSKLEAQFFLHFLFQLLVFSLPLHTASLLCFSQFQVWLIKEKVFKEIVQLLDQLQWVNEGGWQYVAPALYLTHWHLFNINRYHYSCDLTHECQSCVSSQGILNSSNADIKCMSHL